MFPEGEGGGRARPQIAARRAIHVKDGGRGWDRTSDPLDVNEVLSR